MATIFKITDFDGALSIVQPTGEKATAIANEAIANFEREGLKAFFGTAFTSEIYAHLNNYKIVCA